MRTPFSLGATWLFHLNRPARLGNNEGTVEYTEQNEKTKQKGMKKEKDKISHTVLIPANPNHSDHSIVESLNESKFENVEIGSKGSDHNLS